MGRIWRGILNFFYPPKCIFCKEDLSTKEEGGICALCRKNILVIAEPYCMKCGRPMEEEEKSYCRQCLKQSHYYEEGRALLVHRPPVSNSVYQMKYRDERVHARIFGRWMASEFKKWICVRHIDVIVPVPLHKKRKRERGFNQAELLAKEIGRCLNIPVRNDLIFRKKETIRQKLLGRRERRKNMEAAFYVKGCRKQLGNVLVIDDIYTTGSTVNGVAKALKEFGAARVFFLTITIGQDF